MNDIPLSGEQLRIVNSKDRNIIVAAGAGAGKTRVLTERVKRLLNSGADATGIVVITFTNLAAEELQERLANTPNANRCFIGTIHSLANTLLSTKYNFSIYTQEIQDGYMKFLINHYAKYATYDDYETLMEAFKQMRFGLCKFETIVQTFKPEVLDELYILLNYNQVHDTLDYRDYPQDVVTMSKVNNVITFDELIQKCSEYFHNHNTHINYLFVDELQDVGYLEYDFLKELGAEHNFFIGDDYQAIYGFKGGDVKIFLSLLQDAGWSPYYLVENYRNGAIILQYANSIIKNAKDIIPKKSICKSGKIGSVDIANKSEFPKFLSGFTNGTYTDYKDWFILVRNNSELTKIAKMLEVRNIPYVTFRNSEVSKAEKDRLLGANAVKVLTIHMSKGSESKNVVLYGDFILNPTPKSKSEEIKVFYVGITRTEEQLFIFNGK